MVESLSDKETPLDSLGGTSTSGTEELDLIRHWLALPERDWLPAWQGGAGEGLRAAIGAGRWRSRRGSAEAHRLLESAIRRVLARPGDWAARLVLLWQGRDYRGPGPAAPDWLAAWLAGAAQRWRQLAILPAPVSLDVTLVIPTYNRLPLLQRAVASLQAQTDPDWRLLIGDDGSSDGTEAYGRALAAADSRISYLRQPANLGLAANFNQLCAQTSTELFANLSDDDVLMPQWLACVRELYRRWPWIAVAAGGYYELHHDGLNVAAKQHGPYYPGPCIADTRIELQRSGLANPFFGGGMLVRKSALAEVAWADPSSGLDYGHWDWITSVLLLARYEVAYSPEILVAFLIDSLALDKPWPMDMGQAFVDLLELQIAEYESLFGAGRFPRSIIAHSLEYLAGDAVNKSEERSGTPGAHPARARLERLRAGRLALGMATDACLLRREMIDGLSGGLIPGLAERRCAPALLELLLQLTAGARQAEPA